MIYNSYSSKKAIYFSLYEFKENWKDISNLKKNRAKKKIYKTESQIFYKKTEYIFMITKSI